MKMHVTYRSTTSLLKVPILKDKFQGITIGININNNGIIVEMKLMKFNIIIFNENFNRFSKFNNDTVIKPVRMLNLTH